MRVVILAAGMGTRLGRDHPKPLTVLSDGRSILQSQIEAFTQHLTPDRITLLVGHQKERIIEAFPELNYLVNPSFAETNTAKSLLCALRTVDEDCLWINGDVVFHPSVLVELFKAQYSSMLVNRADVGEEEIKYRTDSDGWIVEVSKTLESGEGEAPGINVIKRADLPLFIEMLESVAEQDYFEKALELSAQKGMRIFPHEVPTEYCVEVDFPEDLDKANALLESWD